jgi:ABC-2 type transport system permease protein
MEFSAFVRDSLAMVEVELRKLRRDPTELLTRAVQPVLWLLVFGQVFSQVRGIPTGSVDYLAFMTPGILAQSVLFSGIFYGIAVIWERDLGIVHKLLVSPAPRASLVLGKALAAGVRGIAQGLIIYALALTMGIALRLEATAAVGVLAGIVLGSAIFSTLSLIIACLVKTRERFMGIGQLLTMPLFFASNAIYPLELMPGWLVAIARVNPLTYLVDLLRALMITGAEGAHPLWLDFGVLAATLVALVIVAARLFPGLAR